MDETKKYEEQQQVEEKKKNNKKWLLLLLLLLFLCLFGYLIFRIGFSVGKRTKPVSPDPTPQKMLIKITDANGEWGGPKKIVKIETNPSSLSLEFNESHTIFAMTTSTEPIRWTSSDESCVTISPKQGENPTVTAGNKECTAVITARSGDAKSEIVVTVIEKHDDLKGIKLNQSDYEVEIGGSVLASVTVLPTTAKLPDLIYKIEDSSIATVDENGVIRGISEGKTKLIVTTKDGKYTSTATVTVKKKSSYDNENVNIINVFSDIVSTRGFVAPYDKGVYEFDVENIRTKDMFYDLELDEDNVDRVNIKYRLKKNGNYIVGESGWVYYNEIDLKNMKLAAKATDNYQLEWSWVSEDNELDTKIGLKPERAEYILSIKVLAYEDVEG